MVVAPVAPAHPAHDLLWIGVAGNVQRGWTPALRQGKLDWTLITTP